MFSTTVRGKSYKKRSTERRLVANGGNAGVRPQNMEQKLALDFIKTFHTDGKNLIVSPFSLYACLSMLLPGAEGTTRTELLQMLLDNRYICPNDTIILNHNEQLRKFYQDNQNVFCNPNFLYVKDRRSASCSLPIKQKYIQALNDQFGAMAKNLDFLDMDKCARQINDEVAQSTRGLIQNVVNKDKLEPSCKIGQPVMMILINTIYFRGRWLKPFEHALVKDNDFQLANGEMIKVKTMFKEAMFHHYYHKDLKMDSLKLEFESGSIFFVLLLPDRDNSVKSLLQKLNIAYFNHVLTKLEHRVREISLYLPKFEIENGHDMTYQLRRMGLKYVFKYGLARFPAISDSLDQRVHLGPVIQKALIKVGCDGMEANDILTPAIAKYHPFFDRTPHIFKADRPFIYMMVSQDKKHILSIGVVEHPKTTTCLEALSKTRTPNNSFSSKKTGKQNVSPIGGSTSRSNRRSPAYQNWRRNISSKSSPKSKKSRSDRRKKSKSRKNSWAS